MKWLNQLKLQHCCPSPPPLLTYLTQRLSWHCKSPAFNWHSSWFRKISICIAFGTFATSSSIKLFALTHLKHVFCFRPFLESKFTRQPYVSWSNEISLCAEPRPFCFNVVVLDILLYRKTSTTFRCQDNFCYRTCGSPMLCHRWIYELLVFKKVCVKFQLDNLICIYRTCLNGRTIRLLWVL